VQVNAHSTVETMDLLRAIEKATGRNLQFLFDQYVLRGGHPDYTVSYRWDGDSNLAKITVVQTKAKEGDKTSTSELFDLKIPIGFGYGVDESETTDAASRPADVKSFTVRVHEREQSFYFPLEQKPQFISFDVGNHVLKTVTLEYPVAELKAQLHHDPDPLSRIYAAEALAKKGGLEAIAALAYSLQQDPFWGVRVEVADKLATIKLDQAFEELVKCVEHDHPRVRRAVVQALAKIKTKASYKALKAIAEDGDDSYYVEAAAIKGLGTLAASTLSDGNGKEEKKAIKLLTSILEKRAGWNEVVRSGAIAGLSEMKSSEDALNLILDYTALGVPQPLRLAAIRALGAISSGQSKPNLERILTRLDDLSGETFFLTQVAVVTALGQMETKRAIAILKSLATQSPDGRVRRRAEEAAQKVQNTIGKDEALKKIQDELDQVKKENQELRSRLEALEAKAKTE
jgi:aminopeptidase N